MKIDSAAGRGTTIGAAISLTAPAAAVPDADLERRRMTAIKWIGWENWEARAELYEQITSDDNLVHGKAMLLCLGATAGSWRRSGSGAAATGRLPASRTTCSICSRATTTPRRWRS